jgi:hypothetical protein
MEARSSVWIPYGVVVGKGRPVTDEGTNRDYRKAVTYCMGLI